MDNLLIEARQLSANAVYNDGDWNTTLATPITILEGDIIEVSKAFIDTVAITDDKMVIEEDITLNMSNIMYATNYLPIFTYDNLDPIGATSTGADGKDYIWCDDFPVADPRTTHYKLITQLGFSIQHRDKGTNYFGGGSVRFVYTDLSGKVAYGNTNTPLTDAIDVAYATVSFVGLPLSVKADGSDSGWAKNNISESIFDTSGVTNYSSINKRVLTPRIFNNTIDIDKGAYNPSDMVALINNAMSNNQNNDTNFTQANLINSPYLSTSAKTTQTTTSATVITITDFSQPVSFGPNARIHYSTNYVYTKGQPFTIDFSNIHEDVLAKLVASGYHATTFNRTYTIGSTAWNYPSYGIGEIDFYFGGIAKADLYITSADIAKGGTYTITTHNHSDYRYLCKEDGDRVLSFTTPADNYFIGSNQMELSFNTNSNKFYWQYLHFPVYESGGSIISAFGQDSTIGMTENTWHFGKIGGVAWHNLSAYKRGDPTTSFDFFDAKLGFDVKAIAVDWGYETKTLASGNFHMPVMTTWGDGTVVTSARPTLDAVVDKTDFTKLDTDLLTLKSSNDLTTEIYAPTVRVKNNYLTSAFFYIELQCGMFNTIIGTEMTRNISAVVSRYYSQGSYTSMENTNDLVYQHKGVPLYLQDMRVRILNPSRELSTDIGSDNTIMVSIVRSQDVPQK